MKTSKLGALLFTFVLLSPGTGAGQQERVRSEKAAFQDAASWPQTAPGQVKLRDFRPFRAVYQRSYNQASGPNAGQLRTDRVIVHAEEVGWDGKAAILVTLIDSGDPKWNDTAARSLFMVIDRQDMHVYFESGPVPGKAKDYYFAQPETGVGTMVTTADGIAQIQKFPAGLVGWGPGSWVLASMDLKEGMKILLGPFITPGVNIFTHKQGIVKGRKEFVDAGSQKHNAWLIENGGTLSSSRMGQIYVAPQPPYFLASFSRDLDSGQETNGTRLVSFQYLD